MARLLHQMCRQYTDYSLLIQRLMLMEHLKLDLSYCTENELLVYTSLYTFSPRRTSPTCELITISSAVQNVLDIESQMSKVESMMKEERYTSDADQKSISDILEGLTKQQELAKSQMTKAFESGIGQMQGYQEQISNAKADVGNRITRLDLTKSRLTEQKTNFTSLKSENEDIDLEEVVISYTSAQLVYNAALSAASKVVQQTLLDFIG